MKLALKIAGYANSAMFILAGLAGDLSALVLGLGLLLTTILAANLRGIRTHVPLFNDERALVRRGAYTALVFVTLVAFGVLPSQTPDQLRAAAQAQATAAAQPAVADAHVTAVTGAGIAGTQTAEAEQAEPTETAMANAQATVDAQERTQAAATARAQQQANATADAAAATTQATATAAAVATQAAVPTEPPSADDSGLTVAQTQLVDDSDGELAPSAGMKYIRAHITFTNTSDQSRFYSAATFQVEDASDHRYDFTYSDTAIQQSRLTDGTLSPGDSVQGDVSFEVPSTDDSFTLLWDPSDGQGQQDVPLR